jgi:hypothetical protein
MASSAFQLGWEAAHQKNEEKRQRKLKLEDEARQDKVKDLFEQRQAIRQNLADLNLLDATKPEIANDPRRKNADAAMLGIQTQLDELHDPVKNPGALQRDWEFIKGLVGRKKTQPAAAPAAPPAATSAGAPAATATAAAPPPTPAQLRAQNEVSQFLLAAPLTEQQKATFQSQSDFDSRRLQIENSNRLGKQLFGDDWTKEDEKNTFQTALGVNKTPKYFSQIVTTKDPATGVDHYWRVPQDPSMQPQEVDFNGQRMIPKQVRKVKIGVVPSKQSPTGYAEIWGDPYGPGDQTQWSWTPIAATRYQQTIQTTGYSKDPFGAITSSGRVTGPANQQSMDLSGIGVRPEGYAGIEAPTGAPPGAAPATTATAPAVGGDADWAANYRAPRGIPTPIAPPRPSAQTAPTRPNIQTAPTPQNLKQQVPTQPVVTNPHAAVGTYGNPLPLDENLHVPDSAGMPENIKGFVDRLLDGADIDKMGLAAKDKAIVQQNAEKYGWSQGLFTPKEKLLIREAGSFLKKTRNSKSLDVLGNYWSRQKISNAIEAADPKGTGGFLSHQIAMTFSLTPEESDFVQQFLQLRGVVSGLSGLSRGGRTTEAGISRLQAELPNPMLTHDAATARQQLDRLLSEITVAQKQGFIADTEEDSVGSRVDALDRLVGGMPALPAGKGGGAPPAPKAAPSAAPQPPPKAGQPAPNLKPGGIVYRTNPDGSKTPMRYKGGAKNDPNNYVEVPNAPAANR